MNVTRNKVPKNLRALLAGLPTVPSQSGGAFDIGSPDIGSPDIEISDLTLDSRKVTPGAGFVALPGLHTHGISFAAQAVSAGARVILWEPVDGVSAPALPKHVALIAVAQLGARLGTIVDRFFDSPSQAVTVAGVTGTNGKTTTAYVLAAALARLGRSSAYAGTLGYGPIDAVRSGTHTTPDCITVHRQIAELRDAAVSHLGMEISSHALDQRRIDGVQVDTAIFTNLTHDHLDYHGTFEAYGAAKARLLAWPGLRHAVINIDDTFGRQLAAHHVGSALTVCTRSAALLASLPASPSAFTGHVIASKVDASDRGLDIDIDSSWGAATLNSRFVGDFNVDNLLAVLGVLLGWDVPLADAVNALAQCLPPPGRMETFAAPGRPLAIVDYAHTPDALEKALRAARSHCKGKLICVFGCGGDRDARKRPVMGEIAERLADVAIVTDDNPRTEDGDAIVVDIVKGLQQPQRVVIERDRARAIGYAIQSAQAGDVVLIAGKGHEDYQIVGLETRYFSDRDVVQAALQATLQVRP